MTTDLMAIMVNLLPWMFAFVLGFGVYQTWRRERELDRMEKRDLLRQQELLRTKDEERQDQERGEAAYRRHIEKTEREEREMRGTAGGGTGGYIVIDLPDSQRALFHDLLKGFEEYAQLKGYQVAFSADSTYPGYISFKFTLTNPDVVVSGDRVRRDLKEYLEKVASGEPLDDLPRILSLQEHDVLVATLKNRISFLQHSFNLAKTSAEFYEKLLRRTETLPVLPPPSVVVQTGGLLSAPTYSAVNSPQALIGHHNTAGDQIYIAQSFTERKSQIEQLSKLLSLIQSEPPSPERDELARNVTNVKEELETTDNPEPRRVAKWLQRAKELCQLGSLGTETVAAVRELLKVFGIG